MRYRYYVHHIDRDDNGGFTAEQRAYEYRMLPNLLSNFAHGNGMSMTCAPNEADQHGVIVQIDFDGVEDRARTLLTAWLTDLNGRIPGLNFLVEPADPI